MRSEREFLLDVLDRLKQAKVEYMLTGSMASNYWGIPRTTHDLDFVLVMQPSQVPELVSAFASGFFIQAESVRRVFHPPHQFNVIDEKSALKADFWLLRENLFERSAFERRISVSLFGATASIASAEDVLLHKLYWNRITPSERQLLDAAGVYTIQTGKLDIAYLQQWATVLGVQDELEAICSGRITPKKT